MENIIFWGAAFVSFGLGGIACWAFLALPAIKRAYFNGGFDSFPEHFEEGRAAGYSSGWASARSFYTNPEKVSAYNEMAKALNVFLKTLYGTASKVS
jgi:hypothetical protein